ncbi:MAG: hypothetical protein HKN92_04120 [Chitinophagales bacterium]|nr:hypothetical protein [Chitinophagales bacterium]
MNLIIKIFAILTILTGISLLVKPEGIIGLINDNIENISLYISAIVARLVLGGIFIVAAGESKFPHVLKFFGYLFIIAALIFIIIGQENFQDFIATIIPAVKPFAPISGLLCIVFGGFLIYAFSKKKELEPQ